MDTILYIIAGPLFLISFAGYLYVKLSLKPKEGSDLDDYYYEFEDQHPGLAKYTKWSKITFTVAVIAALLLFLTLVFWNSGIQTVNSCILVKNYHPINVKMDKIS